MSDHITQLPTDDYPLTADEQHLFNTVINQTSTGASIMSEIRIALILGVLFVCLNMPFTEAMLESMLPYAKSSSSAMLICKTAAFVIIMFIVQNYHLVS